MGKTPTRNRRQIMSASGEKQTPKNRTYTVEDIAAILGIGKSSAYKLANSGEFQTIRIGNMIRISRKSFEDWLGMEDNEE
jgi:excisionase family DNA binding protein